MIGTVLIDLSKAYDCIQHDLLIAKLEAYCFSFKSLLFIQSYLSNRRQRVKIGSLFSTWLEVVLGVPQGSILGPLLFNIFLNDLFYFVLDTDICNFADDNTIYACETTLQDVKDKLTIDLTRINTWFDNNSLIANADKFQIMFLGTPNPVNISINNTEFVSKDCVKLLGIYIDNNLNFHKHIETICKTVNNKVSQLLRLRYYMSIDQARSIVNAYIFPYFLYCPLIWMFCRKKYFFLINRVHKRALRCIRNNFSLSLEDLLLLENSVNFHVKHLQCLMIETFKSIRHDNPELMWDLFSLKDRPYDLRGQLLLKIPPARTKTYGINSLIFKASILWNTLPNEYKQSQTVAIFKLKIKKWLGSSCHCYICK